MNKNDLISEEELLNWLKIDTRTLIELRLKKGFPYHPITSRVRFYSRAEVSEWVKNHYSLLSRIVSGNRNPSLKLASLIEEATNGAVSRLELLYPEKENTNG